MRLFDSILIVELLLTSCMGNSQTNQPLVKPKEIQKDLMSWLYYERDNMVWSGNYVTYDESNNKITKKEFLTVLTDGTYLPLRLISDTSICYKLYKLNDKAKIEFGDVIKNKAMIQLRFYNMEGLPLPDYQFTDLENNIYNKVTTEGKIVVIKGWFINCIPCVKEFPRLNKLVKEYKDRNDILFVSLAFDKEDKLREFLKKTTLKYETVPDRENYLRNVLRVDGYPVHIILNKEGLVVNVTNDIEEMIDVLKNVASK